MQLAKQGLSDYKIARKINTDPPSVTRSRKNTQKKLEEAMTDLEWATRIGVPVKARAHKITPLQHFILKVID